MLRQPKHARFQVIRRRHPVRLAASLVLLATVGLAAEPPIPRVDLAVRKSIPVGLTKGVYFLPLHCTQDSLFIRMADNVAPLKAAISRVAFDGKVAAKYSVESMPKELGNDPTAGDYVVLPDGSIVMLASTSRGEYLAKYRPDGKYESATKLSLGRASVSRIAALPGGRTLMIAKYLKDDNTDEPQTLIV